MTPMPLEQTFQVCRSSLHQLCCEEASRSDRRYHISKCILMSLATDEELQTKDEFGNATAAAVRELVQNRIFPRFFGGHRQQFKTDDHTDGVPRLCNALDFVTGFIHPEGTKLFSGITYLFKTLTPMKPGKLKLITTKQALAVGLRAVLVNPVHEKEDLVEVAITTSACVELRPWDTVIHIGYES